MANDEYALTCNKLSLTIGKWFVFEDVVLKKDQLPVEADELDHVLQYEVV